MSSRTLSRLLILTILVSLSAAALLQPLTNAQNSADPWSAAQTIQPNDLLKELADTKSAPTVVYVGFQRLYTSGHIKGAQFHGSAQFQLRRGCSVALDPVQFGRPC